MKRWRRVGIALLALVGLALIGVFILVALEPFPEKLRAGTPSASLRVFDRQGRLLAEVTREGERSGAVRLGELPPHLIQAVLAAEDARFRSHPGVDVFAMLRAAGQAVLARRLVSGASTITQQLARAVVERPRTVRGKLHEMIVALRIERELDKDQILEAYLNYIEFGPRVRGLDAASRAYFDKPASRLDWAESALLVGLPRGPSLYDPTRGVERATRRRDRILERLHDAGDLSDDEFERARSQPVRIQKPRPAGGAEHLARGLARGKLIPNVTAGELREVTTTLDGNLQAEVEGLTHATMERLRAQDASAAAVLVIDNASREVLAYVGSPDFWSTKNQGQNDGTRALRQPGSALKPFVYAAAMASIGYTPATLLPDVELHLPTPRGDYSPRNYDGQFHGPVRLRQALASSLNIPAVVAADRTGPDRVLQLLHRFGFSSLGSDASQYGAAIALGDGEVTLAELGAAYATLANHGEYRALGYVRGGKKADQTEIQLPERPTSRALSPPLARLLLDLLADAAEREAGFGRNSVLELPFPVAVKTGTSKGYRDNWTVGSSSEVTVAVWVGNFDGRPMLRSSGVTGAGPLFHDVLLAAMKNRTPRDVVATSDLPSAEICPLSGALVGPHCPHHTRERFLPGTVPHERCALHEAVEIVPTSGLRAGPRCAGSVTRVFETYPEPYVSWAEQARRPLAPTSFDPRCPGSLATSLTPTTRAVVYPLDGAHFTFDTGLSAEQQRLVFRARGSRNDSLTFWLDGSALGRADANQELAWPLARGRHRLHVESSGARSESIEFTVD